MSHLMSEEEKFKIGILLERFNENQVLRPHNMFDLNRGMMLSAATAITTYIIVLMQFKAGES